MTIHTSSSTSCGGDRAVSVLGASMLTASVDKDDLHQVVLENPPHLLVFPTKRFL